jgi:hypothetical protein
VIVTPGKGQGRLDGGVIARNARSKSPQFHRGTLVSPSQPGVQAACLSLPDHLHKVLSQFVEFLKVGMLLAEPLNERSLACRELLRVFDE